MIAIRRNRGSARATLLAAAGALLAGLAPAARAQDAPMACTDVVPQSPAKVFRSGLWRQWIVWSIPGPAAYAAVERVVAEVNAGRAAAGLPLLVPNPFYEILVSVFEERNARGANGSSVLPDASNREAFLGVFVDDDAGGSEVLVLADPLRSNAGLAAKKVPGVPASVRRSVEQELERAADSTETRWSFATDAGDAVSFAARYGSAAVYYTGVSPLSRVTYANCNLKYSSSLVYRSAPGATYDLFAREESSWVDPAAAGAGVSVRVTHHDPDVHAIFNDPQNATEVLIALERDVRIQLR